MDTASCLGVFVVVLGFVAGNPLEHAGGFGRAAAPVDAIEPSIPLVDIGWTRPAGSSYFVPTATAAGTSDHLAAATWTTECKASVTPDATHTADYQSQYGSWGSGVTLWISFYYRVLGNTGENFRLTLSKIYSASTPVTIWEERAASSDWVKVRLAVREDGEFAFRIAARHACSGSVLLSAVTVSVAAPTTTTTTTTPTTLTTTTTTTTTTKRSYPDPVVTLRVIDLRIPDRLLNGDKCDINFFSTWKCDPYLKLTYNWNGQSSTQKTKISKNTQYVSFTGTGHSGRAAKNSAVQVSIEAWDDDDANNHDHIGYFRSSFSVPNDPSGQLLKSESVPAYSGVGTIQLQYSVQF